jgi:hypothetical protein
MFLTSFNAFKTINSLGSKMKKFLPALLVGSSYFLANFALAAGLASGTAEATNFKNWIYGFLAIVSVIYLLFQILQAYGGKQTWVDVGHACGKVALMGGTPALVTFLWGIWGTSA